MSDQYRSSYGTSHSSPPPRPASPSPKRMLSPSALVLILTALLVGIGLFIYFFVHFWVPATCTAPAICQLCEKTGDAPLDHNWAGAACTQPITCARCGIARGDIAEHTWTPATCTAAQYCTLCGLSLGAPLAHTWCDATCTEPQTCQTCGLQSGSPTGHDWTPASFTAPETCTLCGATSGSAVPYQHITVEEEVSRIREIYNTVVEKSNGGDYRKSTLRKGVVAYYGSSGDLKRVVVYRGTDGIGQYSDTYSRTYYFSNNELVFAFFEGKDSHRLYFYEELLMRWRYTGSGRKAVNYDFEFSEEYHLWESLALEEAATFYD